MEHTLFTIWMLLYYPLKNISEYLGYLAWGEKNREHSDDARGWSEIINVVIYFYVAYLLY